MSCTRITSVAPPTAKQGFVNHAAVADEEVWEAHITLTVHHGGVVMVDAVWEVRCRPKVTVADVQVAQTVDVLVVVNAVVSCLAIFEAIGGRHLFNRAVSGISVCAINRVTVKRNADDFR